MDNAEKSALALERAQKKAARRAAFIQDIAKAVVIAHQTGQYVKEAEQCLAERLAASNQSANIEQRSQGFYSRF